MAKKETIDVAREFLDKLRDANGGSNDALIVTLTAAGLKLEVMMNDIDVDLISEDELLIHLNVVNKVEKTTREVISGHYAPSHDSTFVMKTTYDDDDNVCRMECVGWYCGEPNDEMTQQLSHGGDDLIAIL